MEKTDLIQKIGTVELLKVKSHGRRLYVNLDRDLVECYGIEPGDRLRVKVEELIKPAARATQDISESLGSPQKRRGGERL